MLKVPSNPCPFYLQATQAFFPLFKYHSKSISCALPAASRAPGRERTLGTKGKGSLAYFCPYLAVLFIISCLQVHRQPPPGAGETEMSSLSCCCLCCTLKLDFVSLDAVFGCKGASRISISLFLYNLHLEGGSCSGFLTEMGGKMWGKGRCQWQIHPQQARGQPCWQVLNQGGRGAAPATARELGHHQGQKNNKYRD